MRRRLTQFTTAILANSYFPVSGSYLSGTLKLSVFHLNCYSCPEPGDPPGGFVSVVGGGV